jgi:uncharacterized damage-inducible protein DinB
VIAPLSAAQLNARIAPNQRTVGELAEHIVRGRALWVHKVLGDPSLEPLRTEDETRALLSLLMMVLLERGRG